VNAAAETGMERCKEKWDLPAIVWYIPHQFVFIALGAIRRWRNLQRLCAKHWIPVQHWHGLKPPEADPIFILINF